MSQMNRRQALQLLAALGTTGMLAGCGSNDDDTSATDGSPIKIGLVAPQTGPGKTVGAELINGFQLYLMLNDQRLGGHPVTLVTADEGANPKSGQAAIDGLIKQGVLALTGVVNAAVLSAVRDLVEKARVPLVASNASASSLQSVVYIWRTAYVLDEPGRALGAYLKETMPAGDRIAVIAPEGAAGQDVVKGFQEAFGPDDPRLAGQPVWTTAAANPGDNAFGYDLNQVLARKPDALFCSFAGTAAAQFLRQLRARSWKGALYGPGFLTEGTVLNEVASSLADVETQRLRPGTIQTAMNYSADLNNSANRIFTSEYRRAFNASPTAYAVASYDAAQALDKAIQLAGPNPNPQQVNLAMGKVGQIDSPRGVWQFNQPRTPQQQWYLRRVQYDGQLLSNVLVTEIATLG
ncbi:ABC transporter substrate-binding protein [Micromonospora sp. NPDC000089]|uniref:ABC transporter substrate-binding protein n=1 Tax=unclassified Micromonospora TaxID=2617518 RepID=UPI0036BAAC5A